MSTIIKTKQSFTTLNSETGALTSYAYNTVYTVADALATSLIADGLAEAYSEIDPSGSTSVSANGTYDVTQYETVVVNVGTATVSYDANGGTGEVDAQTAIKGNTITLDDGSGLTAPEGKEFAGWATTDSAEEPDATSPYTVTENVTLYAVYATAN
jgi:hypothetical protein